MPVLFLTYPYLLAMSMRDYKLKIRTARSEYQISPNLYLQPISKRFWGVVVVTFIFAKVLPF